MKKSGKVTSKLRKTAITQTQRQYKLDNDETRVK